MRIKIDVASLVREEKGLSPGNQACIDLICVITVIRRRRGQSCVLHIQGKCGILPLIHKSGPSTIIEKKQKQKTTKAVLNVKAWICDLQKRDRWTVDACTGTLVDGK